MVELDENGKPCRTCNSLTDFQQAMFGSVPPRSAPAPPPSIEGMPADAPKSFFDEPPDSFELGQSSWTFLHSVAAYYPWKPSASQQDEMRGFLKSFSHFYPCKSCATDFEKYQEEHKPDVKDREALSQWMCEAHNAVNTKLGKPTFDCRYWQARWREGWEDFLKSQK